MTEFERQILDAMVRALTDKSQFIMGSLELLAPRVAAAIEAVDDAWAKRTGIGSVWLKPSESYEVALAAFRGEP